MKKTVWKKGDLFKQETGDHSRDLYGIVCAVTEDGKVHALVITFPTIEYSTSAFSPLVAQKMEMPDSCVSAYPQSLPAAVRPQLLSVLAAIV